jgi:hypothetical protein
MPSCFVKEYGVYVDDFVMLRDCNKNTFEVRVDRKNGKIYLRDGWMQMKTFYNLELGAWIKLTYTEPNLMLMSIRHRSGVEIEYPQCNPPIVSRLLLSPSHHSLLRLRCSTVHILSASDIESGTLVCGGLWFFFLTQYPN